jgi:hypothetical protein
MKKYEKLRYRVNAAGAGLAMLFLIFNTVQTIFTLNSIDVSAAGIRVMEVILLNIMLSFLVFVAASEFKRYSLRWSYAGLGLGVFQALRVFFISSTIQGTARFWIAAFILAAALTLFAASAFSVVQGKRYLLALKEQSCPI